MRGESRQQEVGSRQLTADSKQPLSTTYCLLPTKSGFTLVELLITMAVFVFVIAAATSLFVPLLTQFKQQSKIAETNIEGIVGLDIMRRDIESAGYGLPWNIPTGTTYTEALTTTPCGSVDPSTYNDSTSNPPRAVISGNNNCTNSSDYLVIKAVNVATNVSSSKWTELIYSAACNSPLSSYGYATNVCKRCWIATCPSPSLDDLTSGDLVTVIFPGTTSSTERLLKANSGNYTATNFGSIPLSWLPTSTTDNIRIVYGLSSGSNAPQRPFNRADYYVRPLAVGELPRCASGTGVLEKATMDYGGGFTQYPLLDCVADMQVVYALDNDEDGDFENGVGGDAYTNSLGLTAAQIRTRVKEVRLYILAHEGQKDPNYTFNNFISGTSVRVGMSSTFGRDLDISSIPNYLNYRWKLYTLVVKPMDLR